MKKITEITTGLFLVFMLLLSLPQIFASYNPPHQNPGPAADLINFKWAGIEAAPALVEKGELDLYIFGLKMTTAKELLRQGKLKAFQSPASSVSIILNPAPAPQGQLNPFQFKEVRFAIQYLVNREYIAAKIYGQGLAFPMYTHVSPLDYDYLTVYDLIRQSDIYYDPEYAKNIVAKVLEREGAFLKDGLWHFTDTEGKDNPITLTFITRVEDERREIGNVLAADLRKLGFKLDVISQDFAAATGRVYSTDPAVFNWHLYTEGWGRGASDRYDYGTLNQMAAPWLGNMPGWLRAGYWQYQQEELDNLGRKLFVGDFKDIQERNSIYRAATALALEESVRIWVVTLVNTFPANPSLEGVTEDLVAGPKSLFTLREAYIPGKSELNVGNAWVWTPRSTWNPIGGFGDVYSIDIWRNLYDPPLWKHPFTGIPMAFRASYQVETSGVTGKITLPSDAFFWDAESSRWKNVSPGSAAVSKVTFDYSKFMSSKWHHGQTISMADILYSLYQTFDMVYRPEKAKIEFTIATTQRPYLDTFRGFRVVDDHTLEVYLDYWHFIPDYIAEYASLVSLSTPWEVLSAMDYLVFESLSPRLSGSYTDMAAERWGRPWLSLVMPNHATLVNKALEILAAGQGSSLVDKVFTVNGKAYVTPDTMTQRYRASISWFQEKGILVISNGPFWLAKFDSGNQYAQIRAFRDQSYPFKPGNWYLGKADDLRVQSIKGKELNIGYDSTFRLLAQGPGELGVKYLLFDPEQRKIVKHGDAVKESADTFSVAFPASMTKGLRKGGYQLTFILYSDKLSSVSERALVVQAVDTPPGTDEEVTTTTTKATEITKTETGPSIFQNPLMLAGVVVGIVALLGVAIVLKKRKKGLAS